MADILHCITIKAPVETVFDIIATDEGVGSWWTDDSTSAAGVGEVSEYRFMNGELVFRMLIDAYEPGRRLAWSFQGDYEAWDGTTITWMLDATDEDGTVLNLEHSGWPTTEGEFRQCNTSWGSLLHTIRDYAEGKGTAVPSSGRNA